MGVIFDGDGGFYGGAGGGIVRGGMKQIVDVFELLPRVDVEIVK